MKKSVFLLMIFVVLTIACKKQTTNISVEDNHPKILKYHLCGEENENQTFEPISDFTYEFDDEGKVVKQSYLNRSFGYQWIKSFKYNNDGQLVAVFKDGALFRKIFYFSDKIVVYNYDKNRDSTKIAELFSQNDQILQMIYLNQENKTDTLFFDYDRNGNVIKKSTPDRIIEEYLNYDTEVLNPFYLLKSIEIEYTLSNYLPLSKNIYQIERVHPIKGDDFYFGMTDYEVFYEVAENGRVTKITGGKSMIYTQFFEYIHID